MNLPTLLVSLETLVRKELSIVRSNTANLSTRYFVQRILNQLPSEYARSRHSQEFRHHAVLLASSAPALVVPRAAGLHPHRQAGTLRRGSRRRWRRRASSRGRGTLPLPPAPAEEGRRPEGAVAPRPEDQEELVEKSVWE